MNCPEYFHVFFFFNDTATTEIYTLSLHDALPICEHALVHGVSLRVPACGSWPPERGHRPSVVRRSPVHLTRWDQPAMARDRKSTRLNSSHANISYAVFCLKKKN